MAAVNNSIERSKSPDWKAALPCDLRASAMEKRIRDVVTETENTEEDTEKGGSSKRLVNGSTCSLVVERRSYESKVESSTPEKK